VDAGYGELDGLLVHGGPLLLAVPANAGLPGGLLAVISGGRWRVTVVAPDGRRHRLPLKAVAEVWREPLRRRIDDSISPLLDRARLAGKRRRRIRRRLAMARLHAARTGQGWLLRLPPGTSFWEQLRSRRVHLFALRFLLAYAVGYALLLGSWWVLGVGALQGRLVPSWMALWGVVLLTMLPVRWVSVWSRSLLAVHGGALLKQRLLQGALRLQSDEMRSEGAGRFLGRILESEEVESKALNGGFLLAVGGIELALSAFVLGQGITPVLHLSLFALWLAVVCWYGVKFLVTRRRWTAERLSMTHDLVERLIGHRTRLAQEPRADWHREEDRELARYQELSEHYDGAKAWLMGAGGRGWIVLGIAALAPVFMAGSAPRALLAVGLGGVLASYRGFSKLAEGFSHLTGAVVGWEQAGILFHAAARPRLQGEVAPAQGRSAELGCEAAGREAGGFSLQVADLRFRHRGRPEPVLDGCSLAIAPGDRLLLEGPSGGGKSTLAAVLAGLRAPDSGLVLLDGLDRETLGEAGWRRRVALVPQFHENHVLTESLAFNLLMGRGWPAGEDEEAEAVEICRELGLGELLERMPAGLRQLVGETGWQLSHGERSRIFLARALLQNADLVILDESFAALDPATLRRCLSCALRRAPSLLVVAHP
jgi:ATP-binding cassette subfamily B protein